MGPVCLVRRAQATDAISHDAPEAWRKKIHHPLIKHIEALADLSLREPMVRSEADPNESLLYTACSALIQLIESREEADLRKQIGGLGIIPVLASIATHPNCHDWEAVEIALMVYCAWVLNSVPPTTGSSRTDSGFMPALFC